MKNISLENLESILNNESATRQLDNASDHITKYGDNLVFLRTTNKDLEERRLLTPIAVREHVLKPYKLGLINDELEIVVEPQYDTIVDDVLYDNQLIRVGITTVVIYDEDKTGVSTTHLRQRFGVIDTTGRMIIAPKFDNISFEENYNLIVVENGPTSLLQGAGLFDREGKEILPLGAYRKIFDFSNGLARVVSSTDNNKWGIIDDRGRTILPTEYDQVWKFDGKNVDSVRTVKNGIVIDYGFDELKSMINRIDFSDDLPF